MKIGVIGLGLIGGSIFKKCKSLGYEVIGISQSQAGKIENVYSDYHKLKECEVVFVCTPMNRVLKVLSELDLYLSSDTIVSDVCSLKGFVSKKSYGYHFIPTHPMAGTEKTGYENSFSELFVGAKWVITAKDNSDTDRLEILIREMGAEVIYATAKEHDEAVALISHMPLVVSQSIYKAAEDNELAKKLASSGFRDMTRLALSSPELSYDMVTLNSENIETSILKLYTKIGELMNPNYKEESARIKQSRDKMYVEGKNCY